MIVFLGRDDWLRARHRIYRRAQATFSDTSAMLMLKTAAASAGSPVGVRLDTIKLIFERGRRDHRDARSRRPR